MVDGHPAPLRHPALLCQFGALHILLPPPLSLSFSVIHFSPLCAMALSCLFILVWILFIPLAQSLLPYFYSTLLVLFLSDFFIVGLCHHSSWELHTACYFILVWNIGFFCRLTTVTVYKQHNLNLKTWESPLDGFWVNVSGIVHLHSAKSCDNLVKSWPVRQNAQKPNASTFEAVCARHVCCPTLHPLHVK